MHERYLILLLDLGIFFIVLDIIFSKNFLRIRAQTLTSRTSFKLGLILKIRNTL